MVTSAAIALIPRMLIGLVTGGTFGGFVPIPIVAAVAPLSPVRVGPATCE
jgi:hypothetical protein